MHTLFPSSIFRAYDIRGQAITEVSTTLAYRLGRMYPDFINQDQRPIAVGRDVRLSSPALHDALIQGLLDGGLSVFDLGMVATPLTYFSVFRRELAGCIQVTASHNPATDNGFKMMVGQQSLYGEAIQLLRQKLESPLPAKAIQQGTLQHLDLLDEYVAIVRNDCTLQRPLKVVIDAGNGPAGLMAVPLYRAMGCDVIALYCEPDGRFPNHHPDPTCEENMRDLAAHVRQHHADLGLAFDGDGDRIGMVDECGNMIAADRLLLMLARDLLRDHPQACIIAESKSSMRLYQGIAQAGGHGIMWHTGHALIKEKMQQTGALLAGEVSGHIFFADRFYGYDDAVYAGARLLQLLAKQRGVSSCLLSDVAPSAITPEIRIPCADDVKFSIVWHALQYFTQQGFEVTNLDGVRITWQDGWGLLRASNTQAMLVLRFEAETPQRMHEIQHTINHWLKKHMDQQGMT